MLTIRTVLHPTDFSDSSAPALRLARSLAKDYGARLVVLYAYPPPITGAEVVDRTRIEDNIAEDLIAKLRQFVPADAAPQVDHIVMEEHASDAILRTAERENADLIVMGTHGRTGFGRAILGSVAEAVSRRATCPVATVRGELKPSIAPTGAAGG
jgi:universal stress protein A